MTGVVTARKGGSTGGKSDVAGGSGFSMGSGGDDGRSQTFGVEGLFAAKEAFMIGVMSFVRSVILFAIGLALAGTLLEATGWVGREAVRAHEKGGISFKWLNRQLFTERTSPRYRTSTSGIKRQSE